MRRTLASVALAAVPLLATVVNTGATLARETPPTQPEKPNIVVVMTDDQDVASLKYMPRVQKLLIDKGMTFKEQTAVFPLCCPVRAAYLSGQAGHNNNVRGNTAPSGGYENLDATADDPGVARRRRVRQHPPRQVPERLRRHPAPGTRRGTARLDRMARSRRSRRRTSSTTTS